MESVFRNGLEPAHPHRMLVMLSRTELDESTQQIADRRRWARAQGHPEYLWPEIPLATWRAANREIERVTRAVLEGTPTALDTRPPLTVDALGVAAFTTGMGPLLGWWIAEDQLTADAEAAELLGQHLTHGQRRWAAVDLALRALLDRLHAAGVPAVIVKGAHTARRYFPAPQTRPFADVDILVTPRQLPVANSVLADLGYDPRVRRSRPHKWEWHPPESRGLRSLLVTHAENPWAIELHTALDRPFYGVKTIKVPVETEPFPSCHPNATVLSQPGLMAFLALHASEELHHLQLIRLVELVLVARADGHAGALDWQALETLLHTLGATRFAFPALELAERLSPGTLEPSFHQRLRAAAPPRMRALVARIAPGTALRLDHVSLAERFIWASTPAEYLRRAWRLVWPTGRDAPLRTIAHAYRRRLAHLRGGRVSVRARRDPSGGFNAD